MKKKIFVFLLLLIFIAFCAVIYLNRILPVKIRVLVIQGIKEATQKKAAIGSIEFGIFRGLVLRDLIIYDGDKKILTVKECSVSFLIPPIFKKNLILSSVKIKEPEIFLVRRCDNTLNLGGLFPQAKERAAGQRFNIIVNRIILTGGRINFQDDTLSPAFTKTLDNLDANIFLSLPSAVKFNFNGRISSKVPMEASASGYFDIKSGKLISKVVLRNISLADFSDYYKKFDFSLPQGAIDASLDVEFKDATFSIHADAKAGNIIVAKDALRVGLSSDIVMDIKYFLKDSRLSYEGKAKLFKTSVSGLERIGEVSDIAGLVSFDNKGLFSDRITASIGGVSFAAGIKLSDYRKPAAGINIGEIDLVSAQKIVRDKFGLTLPFGITGKAGLSVLIKSESTGSGFGISGYFDIINAGVKLDRIKAPIEGVRGRVEFSGNRLNWQGIAFRYLGMPYLVSGELADFVSPRIQLSLSSEKLSCEGIILVAGKIVTLSQLKGRYLNSGFLLEGEIQPQDLQVLKAKLSLALDLDLKDIKEPLKSFQSQLESINPSGLVHIELDLNGNINNLKSCEVNAQVRSSRVSLYGLKASDLSLICRQEAGILEVPNAHFSSYDGTADLTAALNLNAEHLPYRVSAVIKDIKIEKLKTDTPAKEKEIAGIIQAQVNLNGFCTDLTGLIGQGTINITEGNLWQLNLFQGLGKLIFAKDFANIRFSQGRCGFVIRDRCIFSESIRLKSNLVELSGEAKIGFDASVDASIKIHVLDEAAPLTRTLKDVATAIIGESGSFGRIKISGSLKEPRYKFQPAIGDIIKGLRDSVFENILDF